jgi:SAM-dependent methyltransferase
MSTVDPYDELPYRSLPVEWTAPERLALASLLHGGPRAPLERYRVLELGCADGANLLPLAYYRRHATFVGVDAARSQIDIANAGKSRLDLSNVEFVHADFLNANEELSGEFDFIIGHGVFSWVPDHVRDAMLRLCAKRLCRGGLLYLNYNTHPGWKVRGMVRDFLLAHSAWTSNLRLRAESAQDVAARIVSSLTVSDHAYSKLISDEFNFVAQSDLSYVAHEYLATDNQPYWRSEFMTLVGLHEFEFVADADFNYSSGRIPEDVAPRLLKEHIIGRAVDDTVDLLCYRQLHSPILTRHPFARRLPSREEFAALFVASCLAPSSPSVAGFPMFQHPSGYQVEAKEDAIQRGFEALQPLWPRGLRTGTLFQNLDNVIEDLKLLQRNGLIELRCVETCDHGINSEPLKRLERGKGGYFTTPYHTRVAAAA